MNIVIAIIVGVIAGQLAMLLGVDFIGQLVVAGVVSGLVAFAS